ncbi:hypothetical protein [Streptomyces sp. NPDC093707]|uniref:hypothetical protein n=1 Tax=Streptomyces sp. NPDC093707 TaxID=3154984 RepID=UPI00344E4C28
MLAKNPSVRPSASEAAETLVPLLPKPGDPAPAPVLDPDPTLPFRTGTGAPAAIPATVSGPSRNRRPVVPRRGSRGPDRTAFRALLDEVEREEAEDDAGSPAERLEAMLNSVRRPWGPCDPDVVRARLLCADRLRYAGDWPGAGGRYRTLVRDLDGATPGTQEHARLLEARIGAAECLIPEEDSSDRAFPAWQAAVLELRSLLPHAPQRVVERARESGEDFAEWGHRVAVTDLLNGLPQR